VIEQIVKDSFVAGKDCHIDQKHEVTTIQSYRPTIALTPLPIAGQENHMTAIILFIPGLDGSDIHSRYIKQGVMEDMVIAISLIYFT